MWSLSKFSSAHSVVLRPGFAMFFCLKSGAWFRMFALLTLLVYHTLLYTDSVTLSIIFMFAFLSLWLYDSNSGWIIFSASFCTRSNLSIICRCSIGHNWLEMCTVVFRAANRHIWRSSTLYFPCHILFQVYICRCSQNM